MKNWIKITSNEDVLNVMKKSHDKPQVIFKDSTTCGISAYAKSRLEEGNDLLTGKLEFNYLDLLTFRSVSNFIAEHSDLRHQSPQVIVLKDGVISNSVTHHSITIDNILNNL